MNFDSWTGQGRIELSKVSIRQMPDGISAQFLPKRKRILLSEELELEEIRYSLRHELCHELDFEESITQRDVPQLDAVTEFSSTWLRRPSIHGLLDADDPSVLRREAFAWTCERGPLAANVLAGSRCEEPPLVFVMEWLNSNVWVESPPFEWTWVSSIDIFRTNLVVEKFERLQILETTTPGIVSVRSGSKHYFVQVSSGNPVSGVHETVKPDNSGSVAYDGIVTTSWAGTIDGEWLASVYVDADGAGSSYPIWLHSGSHGQQASTNCSTLGARDRIAFRTDGTLWAALRIGSGVWWGEYGP
ncbi:MAG: hypothetical protein AAGA48_22800 [Myxococcota bacterium]